MGEVFQEAREEGQELVGLQQGGLGLSQRDNIRNGRFEIAGDQALGTKRAKPRAPISTLREKDTDTLARVDNI